MQRKKFTFVDLFAGIGGFRSALTSLGGECLFTNEWNKFSLQTYSAWYGSDNICSEDIREVNKESIPDHDILCGGFPCQPFSISGVSKKNSLSHLHGFEDKDQGNLFFSITEVMDKKRPKIILLENVKNILFHDNKNSFRRIKDEFESRDYLFFFNLLNSKYFVPQSRERVFMVAFDKAVFGKEFNFEYPIFQGESLKLKEILSDDVNEKYTLSDNLWRYLQEYKIKHSKKGNGFGYNLFGPDDTAGTMSARYYKDGAEILIRQESNPRKLTPKEASLLMGFTQKYSNFFGYDNGFPQVVSDTQTYKQFGNAVIPAVVEAIGKEIIKVL